MKTISHLLAPTLVIMMMLTSLLPVLADESPAPDPIPIISECEVMTITDTSAIITWITDIESNTSMRYDTMPLWLRYSQEGETYDSNGDLADNGIYHYLELTDLRPGTVYFYKAYSSDGSSYLRNFTTLTPPEGDYLFSFATMNDTHLGSYRDGNENGKDDNTELVEQVIEEINDMDVAFTIIKGDITHHGLLSEFGKSKDALDNLTQDYYPLIGNHDIWAHDESSNVDIEPMGDQYFQDVFGDMLNAAGVQFPSEEELSTYYSFVYEGYRFINMDSVSRWAAPLDNPGGWPGGVFLEGELEWLENELAQATLANEHVMIFMHHPCTETSDNTSIWPFIMTLDNYEATGFRELIGNYENVVGVFSGHTHRSLVTYASETGQLPYSETVSTSDYPCGYNVYKVYENGYMQSFYKCKLMDLSESIKSTVMVGNPIVECAEKYYRLGSLQDRNFVYDNERYVADEQEQEQDNDDQDSQEIPPINDESNQNNENPVAEEPNNNTNLINSLDNQAATQPNEVELQPDETLNAVNDSEGQHNNILPDWIWAVIVISSILFLSILSLRFIHR